MLSVDVTEGDESNGVTAALSEEVLLLLLALIAATATGTMVAAEDGGTGAPPTAAVSAVAGSQISFLRLSLKRSLNNGGDAILFTLMTVASAGCPCLFMTITSSALLKKSLWPTVEDNVHAVVGVAPAAAAGFLMPPLVVAATIFSPVGRVAAAAGRMRPFACRSVVEDGTVAVVVKSLLRGGADSPPCSTRLSMVVGRASAVGGEVRKEVWFLFSELLLSVHAAEGDEYDNGAGAGTAIIKDDEGSAAEGPGAEGPCMEAELLPLQGALLYTNTASASL